MFDKFDNISDELLAAYLDGNTTKEENMLIEDAMGNDESIMEIADIGGDIISFEGKYDIWKGDYGFGELGIDPVFTREELLVMNEEFENDPFVEEVIIENAEMSWEEHDSEVQEDFDSFEDDLIIDF